jgi:phage-related tail fiber protein
MTIIDAIKQLRNDLKLWVANNLSVKLDNNLGTDNSGKLLSVDETGEVVAATVAEAGIYTKQEVDSQFAGHRNASAAHDKAQVGLGNVDNTSDANKPVSTAQQAALDALKSELSESIVSETEEWTIVDNSGNILLRAGELDGDSTGLETSSLVADTLEAQTANIGNVYTKTEVDALLVNKSSAGHAHTIYASAADDDIVILTGTSGSNGVSYSATHAKTNKAGTYKSVKVDDYGHITAGSNPTTIAGFGITDAYTKTEVDAKISGTKIVAVWG